MAFVVKLDKAGSFASTDQVVNERRVEQVDEKTNEKGVLGEALRKREGSKRRKGIGI